MLSTLRLSGRCASANGDRARAMDVAARATDAAMVAAEAAIKAADAAIEAADAAVLLIDEHEGDVIMLEPAPTPPPRREPERALTTRLTAVGPFGDAPRPRRPTRALALLLILVGTLALADAVVTLVWQEPLSALYAKFRQDHLSGELRAEERALPTPVEQRALARLSSEQARIAFLASALQRRAGDGSPVGRIRIPRIGVNFVVVNGTSTAALQSGPGIYPETSFPGAGNTTAIAGHRTTYLAPFRHIDELRRGDRIQLEMPYAHFIYTVTGTAVVPPTAVRVAEAEVGHPRLVLSACTPLFSAAKRILVFARLDRSAPVLARVVRVARAAAPPPRAAAPPLHGLSPVMLKAG
jgi:sortase A